MVKVGGRCFGTYLRLVLLLSGDVEQNPGPNNGDICAACGISFRRGASPLLCSFGCGRACHKQVTCSGLPRSRQGTGAWVCLPCRQGSGASQVVNPTPVVAGTRAPTITPVNRKCPSCSAYLRPCSFRLVCTRCRLEYHNKCSGLTRDSIRAWSESGQWICSECEKSTPSVNPTPQPVSVVADRRQRIRKIQRLRIIQWNVDGIKTSAVDLQSLLRQREVDVVLVQESKLSSKDKTPSFPGFSVLRRDRPSGLCRAEDKGGVMTLVRSDIPFREVPGIGDERLDPSMEALSVEIRIGVGVGYTITNVYHPPVRSSGLGAPSALCPDGLTVSQNHFIGGDFNCHSPVWDPLQPGDRPGEVLERWMNDHQMECLNDGSATRVNRGTGGRSAPDISLVHSSRVALSEWEVMDALGSDHFPIFCELDLEVHKLAKNAGRLRWDYSNADWSAYTQDVEAAICRAPTEVLEGSVSAKTRFLSESIANAARRHIGMVRSGGLGIVGESQEVREAVQERNRLARTISTRREEWLNACRRVREMRLEEKRRRWVDFVEELGTEVDSAKVWKTIRSLSGKLPKPSGRNVALVHKGREYRTDERKADAFASYYAGVSRLEFSRDERALTRDVRKRLTNLRKSPGCREVECADFSLSELLSAVRLMKGKGAEGADGVSPKLLKGLGEEALNFVLRLFNQSWREGFCPQSWRTAIIVPILKQGKPPGNIDSYRPISLTSCLGKVMERMVANRLSYMAESRGWFSNDQAGFRGLRSTEDQVIRITQSVSDGFQRKPSDRTVLALLDFSKAYDKVWRERLYGRLLDSGVPIHYVLWIKGFLTNRLAKVRINGETGGSVLLRQGLPQGSVLSPLLFLFFIDTLRACVPQSLHVSMYADDVALWSVNNNKELAATAVEAGVGEVWKWALGNKLCLNLAKCEVSFFSNATRDSSWVPQVRVNNQVLLFNPTPEFLGVIYDRTLSFRPQAERAARRMIDGNRVLGALSGQEWGWDTRLLRRVYQTAFLSRANYCGAGWQPWLSQTTVALLDRAQNKCLRKITGVYATAPVKALHLEAGIPSFSIIIRQNAAIALERSLRVSNSNPRREVVFSGVSHRTVRGSWRKLATEVADLVGLTNLPRREWLMSGTPPWLRSNSWAAYTHLLGGSARLDSSERKFADAMDTLRSLRGPFDFTIYTDGSAESGMHSGGCAAVITTGDFESPVVLDTLHRRGPVHTSSFEMEASALEMALEWTDVNCQDKRILICTDSQSCLTGLNSGSSGRSPIMDTTRRLLESGRNIINLQWVPGHCGLIGNEMADREAKVATIPSSQGVGDRFDPVPVSFGAAKALVKRSIRDSSPLPSRLQAVYVVPPRVAGFTRREATLLAQLRTGHCRFLASYRVRFGSGGVAACRYCDLGEEQTLEHLFGCPASIALRLSIFGCPGPPLSVLCTNPRAVTRYLRGLRLL